MEHNIVLSFMSDILEARLNNDEYGLETVRERGRKTYVTLEEVGTALDTIVDEVTAMIAHSQELQEERLKAIVNELSMNTKYRILESFSKAEDDLFTKGDND